MAALRFFAVLILGACFACPYVRLVIAPQKPGRSRALASLPLCAAFLFTPLLFNLNEEILARIVVMFLFSWLATFKVFVVIYPISMHQNFILQMRNKS